MYRIRRFVDGYTLYLAGTYTSFEVDEQLCKLWTRKQDIKRYFTTIKKAALNNDGKLYDWYSRKDIEIGTYISQLTIDEVRFTINRMISIEEFENEQL